jgi:hypothetical protein
LVARHYQTAEYYDAAGIDRTGLNDHIHDDFVGIVTSQVGRTSACMPDTICDSGRDSNSDSEIERETGVSKIMDTK